MISIKSKEEIAAMREGGKILASVMEAVLKLVKPGVNALELDGLAEKLIREHGGLPAFKGYGAEMGNPFPATLCISFNDEVVHGVPLRRKKIKTGDVVKIDVGMTYKGMNTDMARTVAVGIVSKEIEDLIETTRESFWRGIKGLKDGAKLSDYSKRVQEYIEARGFSVVRNLVGHGIGKEVHEDPQVPNYHNKKFQDLNLEAGVTLALEPMVNAGGFETKLGNDGWVFKTRDGSLSAHYENTILITEKGVEVLTV
jgi:methionyl aminopeptidase